jgi:hypothetical protein
MRTDLQPFCSNGSDPRAFLSAPWKDGADVVASNGHIMIVIPGAAEEADADTPPNMAGAAARFNGGTRSGILTPLSSITLPAAVRCQVCGGAGHFHTIECDECDGKGSFKHGSHWYECEECDGEGWKACSPQNPDANKKPCYRCDGSGESMVKVAVGGAQFQRRYLALLAGLPDCLLEVGDEHSMAKFTFAGGYGFLMPVRG